VFKTERFVAYLGPSYVNHGRVELVNRIRRVRHHARPVCPRRPVLRMCSPTKHCQRLPVRRQAHVRVSYHYVVDRQVRQNSHGSTGALKWHLALQKFSSQWVFTIEKVESRDHFNFVT